LVEYENRRVSIGIFLQSSAISLSASHIFPVSLTYLPHNPILEHPEPMFFP